LQPTAKAAQTHGHGRPSWTIPDLEGQIFPAGRHPDLPRVAALRGGYGF